MVVNPTNKLLAFLPEHPFASALPCVGRVETAEKVFEAVTSATGDVPPVGRIYVVPDTITVPPGSKVLPSNITPGP
jgi:hypothetical protein